MIWHSLVLGFASLTAQPVTLRPLEGPPVKGEFVSLSAEAAVIATEGGEQSLPLASVLDVVPANGSAAEVPPAAGNEAALRVLLADGSLLAATSFSSLKGVAKVELHQGITLELPVAGVRYVCQNNLEGELPARWEAIVAKATSADLLVIRKQGKTGQPLLDYLEGSVRDISASEIQFAREENVLPVPRSKAQGVVFVQPPREEEPTPACRITDRGNSQWNVKTVVLAEDTLRAETLGGVKFELPLSQMRRLDYSAGKIVFLSDLEFELAIPPEPAIPAVRTAERAARLLYEPKRDRFYFSGEEMLLAGGQGVSKGLALTSRTELVFRLPARFRRFQALVGMQERFGGGEVAIVLSGDQGVLYEGVINSSRPPEVLDVELGSTRRLRIAVNYGADGNNFGDYVILGEAKVVK